MQLHLPEKGLGKFGKAGQKLAEFCAKVINAAFILSDFDD